MQHCDIAIVGAGTAGIPAAIEAAQAGARVVLIEQSDRVGGTLHISAKQALVCADAAVFKTV